MLIHYATSAIALLKIYVSIYITTSYSQYHCYSLRQKLTGILFTGFIRCFFLEIHLNVGDIEKNGNFYLFVSISSRFLLHEMCYFI